MNRYNSYYQEQELKANASSNMSVHPSVTYTIRMDTANIRTLFGSAKIFVKENKKKGQRGQGDSKNLRGTPFFTP